MLATRPTDTIHPTMSTIAPRRLKDVSNAALFRELSGQVGRFTTKTPRARSPDSPLSLRSGHGLALDPLHASLRDLRIFVVHGFNFTILAEEIAKRVATYQIGSRTTVIGPLISGDRMPDQFWRDALGGEFRCTPAETPGT